MAKVTDILVESLVSSRTHEPVVQIRVLFDNGKGQTTVQMSPEEARGIAQHIMEAAESATVDAFLNNWCRTVLQASESQAAGIMKDFRDFREARVARNTEQPQSQPEEESDKGESE